MRAFWGSGIKTFPMGRVFRQNVHFVSGCAPALKSNTNTQTVCVCVSVLAVPLCSTESLSIGSPDSCSKRQRWRANQLMLIVLFTRPRGTRERGGREGGRGGAAQTNTNYRPVQEAAAREELGRECSIVVTCFLLHLQTLTGGSAELCPQTCCPVSFHLLAWRVSFSWV